MKKIFKFAMMAIAMMAVSTAFVSCGGDDSNSPGTDTPTETIQLSVVTSTGSANDVAVLNKLITYINTKIGSGSSSEDGKITVPLKNKDKAIETLKSLNNDCTWADDICKSNGATNISLAISYNNETLLDYTYPRLDFSGTYTGTIDNATFKVVVKNDAKANPNTEGTKVATVTVPEGMEIAAGEYTCEWYYSINYYYVYSDKCYGDTYDKTNAYIRVVFMPKGDGTFQTGITLKYQVDGTVKQKSRTLIMSKQ